MIMTAYERGTKTPAALLGDPSQDRRRQQCDKAGVSLTEAEVLACTGIGFGAAVQEIALAKQGINIAEILMKALSRHPTRKALAHDLGLSHETVGAWLRRSNPVGDDYIDTLRKIAGGA